MGLFKLHLWSGSPWNNGAWNNGIWGVSDPIGTGYWIEDMTSYWATPMTALWNTVMSSEVI